jgi:hypothetical protein
MAGRVFFFLSFLALHVCTRNFLRGGEGRSIAPSFWWPSIYIEYSTYRQNLKIGPGVNLECICMSEMDEPQLDHILKPSPDPNSNQPIKGPFGYLSTRISYETDLYGNHITPFHFLWDSVLSKKVCVRTANFVTPVGVETEFFGGRG